VQLTKDQAREESLRRWRALPVYQRQTIDHAQVFAAALADELNFHTMANRRRVIESWLIQDIKGEPAWGKLVPESISIAGLAKPARDPAPLLVEAVQPPAEPELPAGPDVEIPPADDDILWVDEDLEPAVSAAEAVEVEAIASEPETSRATPVEVEAAAIVWYGEEPPPTVTAEEAPADPDPALLPDESAGAPQDAATSEIVWYGEDPQSAGEPEEEAPPVVAEPSSPPASNDDEERPSRGIAVGQR
jgi:hypothetical protein